MKQLLQWTLCLFVAIPSFAQHPLTDRICQKLNDRQNCYATLEFQVSQPMTNEEVIYYLQSICSRVENDTLSDFNYYIEVDSASHPISKGNFFTYFDGHYYDFSNERLREYHIGEGCAPFRPIAFRGRRTPGVHESGLFVGEIPLKQAEMLQSFLHDSCYQIEERPADPANGRMHDEIRAKRYINDELVRTADISFDPETGLPVRKEVENSPNKMSSQSVITLYHYPEKQPDIQPGFFTEARLLQDKKEIVSTYRTSNYHAEQMKGRNMQPFSLQELNKNQRFDSQSLQGKTTVLAFVKSNISFCDSTVAELTRMNEMQPGQQQATVILLYSDKLPQQIDPEAEQQSSSSTTLYNAGDVALRYGVSVYPTLFVVDKKGQITDVQIGYARNFLQTLTNELAKNE